MDMAQARGGDTLMRRDLHREQVGMIILLPQ